MKVCRICLSSDGRLYEMKNQLNSLYKQLTGLDNFNKRLPQWLCAECGLRLMSYDKLRQNSLRSHKILCQILGNSKNITKKTMLQINSLRHASNLTFSNTNLAVYNPNIDDQEEHNLTINNPEPSDLLELKEEKEDLLDDSFEIEFESVNLKADDNFDQRYDSDSLKADIFDLKCDTNSNKEDEEEDFCDVEYLEEEEIVEDQSEASMESDKEYLPSDSSDSTKEPLKISKTKVKKEVRIPEKAKEDELNKYFTITQLSLKEQVGEIERRKESPDYAVANYTCDFCFKWFTVKESYDDHMFKHSSKSGEMECLVCRIRTKTAYSLNHHMRRTHAQLFKCNSCDFVTTVRGSAHRHGKLHAGAVYLCPYCVRQFNDVTTYWRHVRMRHNTSAHVCAECGHSFLSARGLLVHRVKKHRGKDFEITTQGPRCEKCNVTFASEEAYKTHLRVSIKHKVERSTKVQVKRPRNAWRIPIKPNPCEECGVQMRNFKAYTNHFRRFHPDSVRIQNPPSEAMPCMCELCGILVQHSMALEVHMASKHGTDHTRNHFCKDCPKMFSKAAYLIKHYKKVHNKHVEVTSVSSAKSRECQQCGKTMASKDSLRMHMRIHDMTRKKMFSCKQCGKSFFLNCRLKRHMTIHREKTNFKCKYCDKVCSTKIELTRHVTSTHNRKNYINIAKIKIK